MIFTTLWVDRQSKALSDIHGQPVLGPITRERVCPIKLIFTDAHTTVRTDSSASHGQAYEVTANVVLLAMPKTKIKLNDILTVKGRRVQVIQLHERYTTTGVVDHIEIHCTSWA